MKTPIKIINNLKNNTFHPILYRESPLPGNSNAVVRYKSIGHHTTGFTTRDEAINEVNSESFKDRISQMGSIPFYITNQADDILWNGEDVPADTLILAD